MTRLLLPFLVFFISLTIGSCGTGEHLVTHGQIQQVKIGASTKENVRMILGNPKTIILHDPMDAQSETWIYTYAKYASDPYTGVPPLGMTSVPISRNHRKTPEIHIIFDQNGVVTSILGIIPP